MPGPGVPRDEAADIYAHVFVRVVELTAGTDGERLFLPGAPWHAVDDEKQALACASLITSSPAAAALVAACRVEARGLLTASAHIVRALAAELLIRRTLTGIEIDSVIVRAIAAKLADAEMSSRMAGAHRIRPRVSR